MIPEEEAVLLSRVTEVFVEAPKFGVEGRSVLRHSLERNGRLSMRHLCILGNLPKRRITDLDVVAKSGEQVPGEAVDGGAVVCAEDWRRELGLDVIDDLLDSVNALEFDIHILSFVLQYHPIICE